MNPHVMDADALHGLSETCEEIARMARGVYESLSADVLSGDVKQPASARG